MLETRTYRPFEIDRMLDSMILLVDTRENERTEAYKRRIEAIGLPHERVALSYADYSCKVIDPSGDVLDMRQLFAIERKSGLSELCNNFTSERERFGKEFQRAEADGCRIHLIVENDNYEKLRHGNYRSKLNPQSLIASALSWSIKYNIQLHFCRQETTGWLIAQILRYELRHHLLYDARNTG